MKRLLATPTKPTMYATASAVAEAMCCTGAFVRKLIETGVLRGFALQLGPRASSSERARRTPRGRWVVEVASVTEFIKRRAGKAGVTPPMWRKARKWRHSRLIQALTGEGAGL